MFTAISEIVRNSFLIPTQNSFKKKPKSKTQSFLKLNILTKYNLKMHSFEDGRKI